MHALHKSSRTARALKIVSYGDLELGAPQIFKNKTGASSDTDEIELLHLEDNIFDNFDLIKQFDLVLPDIPSHIRLKYK